MTMKYGLALVAALSAQTALAECGDAQARCEVSDGGYFIELPLAPTPPLVVFLHGYGGSGTGTMRNRSMVEPLLARGYAVMAPEGAIRNGRKSWNFYPGWDGRDEAAFLADAVRDAVTRFDIDPAQVVLGGFSAGGFMVNYLACAQPDSFSAYAPVSGGFWQPHPDACNGPVRLLHTHGWTDTVVPLEGRFLGEGQYQQGDIFAGLEIWRRANACAENRPDSFGQIDDRFMTRRWTDCASNSALEFALFPGGHTVPEGWADMMVDWYEGLPGG